MFYDKDIGIFFKDFGEVATTENNDDFIVIFDNVYQSISPFSSTMSINSRDLFCSAKNSDIKKLSLKAKQNITIDNVLYVIKNIQWDRTGVSELQLQFVEED